MNRLRSILPFPGTSVALALFWMLLVNELSWANAALALGLGLLIPLLTQHLRASRRPIRRAGAALRLAGVFLLDMVIANLTVAALVLGPRSRIRPAFIEVALDLDDGPSVGLLAAVVSLTPGTVSVDFSPNRRTLLVHALRAPDPAATARRIKLRYEARIKEVFEC